MSGSLILSIVTFIYGLAGFLYICAWIFRKQILGRIATWIALVGLVGNTAGILMRWVESYQLGIGHAPFSNLYESLVFFAWVIVLIYLIVERKIENRIIGAFTTPIACLVMAYASLKPGISSVIQPLIPALKSNWLIAHVITCFIGYAAFALAFGVNAMYLVKKGRHDQPVIWVEIVKPLTLYVFAALFSRVLFVHSWLSAVIIAIPICLVFYAMFFWRAICRQNPKPDCWTAFRNHGFWTNWDISSFCWASCFCPSALSPAPSGPIRPGGGTGAGTPRRPGRWLPGSYTPRCCMPA